jgi:Fur family peroxide stress response transcriptional regulator
MNNKIMSQLSPKRTRRTPQKLAVAAFLEGNQGHPSAEEIHRALQPRFPTMSLSTVYNILRGLQREGRVHELAVGCGKARFDPEPAPHHHLVCLECRKVVDVDRDFDLALGPGEARGFRVLHHHVGFYGTCPDCQSKAKRITFKETH